MNEYEENKKELEDILYALDSLDGIITNLKQYADCKDIVAGLNRYSGELEFIVNELEDEIDEEEGKMMSEYYNEVLVANYEFEGSRI